MNASGRKRVCGAGSAKVAALLMLITLCACGGGSLFGSKPEPPAPPPPPPAPPPPAPPPVDMAGRWRLSAIPGRACFMNFADTQSPAGTPSAPDGVAAPPAPAPAFAIQGTIAPEGGCPGSFFTSRKWTFEHGMLIIRDFKNQPLAQLSYSGDHFEGQDANGKLTLSK
jgi:hypothetical protein